MLDIGLIHYLVVSIVLVSAGVATMLTKRNAIGILIGVELILNAAAVNLVAFSRFHPWNPDGQPAIDGLMFALFIIVLAAAEAAVALAIFLNFYNNFSSIDVEKADELKGYMTPTQQTIRTLLAIATLAPLFSALLVIFMGKRLMGRGAGWFATAVMGGATVCSVWAWWLWMTQKPGTILWAVPWIPLPGTEAGWLYLGVMADSLTIAMMVMVTLIATLVHLYSIGYMEGDSRYSWFFAYLSLFSFSMLGIVVSNSILMLFVFWELVGLTSYLLIGFWFEKRGPRLACKKAFVMNRIGDMGFLIGFGILFYQLGARVLLPAAGGAIGPDGHPAASMFEAIRSVITAQGYSFAHPPLWLTAAGIGLFCGAIGKSAQFPLHTWLPDAMEGPTPVSSIVHSATMVAAGVYLTARIYPILTPSAHLFVAMIGLITLVIAAAMALVMTDIKRVLAYSTLSQLGYMMLGLGTGAYVFALFHLIAHAFFKCCLFQCAGSVIHGAHHQQDMRYYGGLWRKMPVTALCYLVCTLAIAGASIPFAAQALGFDIGISGFYSKDGIIAGTANYADALYGQGWWAAPLFFWGPAAVAYVTVFYMARSFTLTFLGQPRDPHLYENAHEAPWTMKVPQIVLAMMAVVSVPWLLDWVSLINPTRESMAAAMSSGAGVPPAIPGGALANPGVWVQPGVESQMEHGFHVTHAALLFGMSWILMLVLGIALYLPGMKYAQKIAALPGVNLLYRWAKEKFYFDALYDSFGVGVAKFVAAVSGWIDKTLVDGLVNLAGQLGKIGASVTGVFDNKVVDGAVNGAAVLAQSGGQALRVTQSGRIRLYVLLLFSAAAAAGLVVTTAVIVMKG